MSGRVTWREGRHQFHAGEVAGIELFQLVWLSNPEKKNWSLYGKFPGLRHDHGTFGTVEEAKEHAEDVLVDFVEKLGGSFYFPPIAG